jgi:hypothetical protein
MAGATGAPESGVARVLHRDDLPEGYHTAPGSSASADFGSSGRGVLGHTSVTVRMPKSPCTVEIQRVRAQARRSSWLWHVDWDASRAHTMVARPVCQVLEFKYDNICRLGNAIGPDHVAFKPWLQVGVTLWIAWNPIELID